MLLTIQAQLNPGSDLGYLLHKHPERHFQETLSAGIAHLFYPEVQDQQATVALWLEVDPVGLVRRKAGQREQDAWNLEQYVNDRPFVASSLMSVAIARCLKSAMNGISQDRPELAQSDLPLKITISVVRLKGGLMTAKNLFEPLGYELQFSETILDSQFPEWGRSPSGTLELKGCLKLSDALKHLYVLLPVLDRYKHYWIDQQEVEKLLRRGEGWLAQHPDYEWITRQYLQDRPSLTRQALMRLRPELETEDAEDVQELELEKPLSLNQQRIQAVLDVLNQNQVQSVVDLGCGEGQVLKALLNQTRIQRIIGVDVSTLELEKAVRKLKYQRLPEAQRTRIELLHGSVLYRDQRYQDVEAALLIEVIEHLEPFQIERLTQTLFGSLHPPLLIVTTPNAEYNAVWELEGLRHHDHRFEWDRKRFARWASKCARDFGYIVDLQPIGQEHPDYGSPTQMAIFSREDAL